MIFTKADKKDINEIAKIEWESGYKWNKNKKECLKLINEVFDEGYCQVYILSNKEPIGYFALSFDKNKSLCYLNYFAVRKKYQAKGFSKTLITKAINIAKKEKSKAIELAVWGKNFPAIGLYNKFGFYVTEIIKNKYSNGDNKLRMRKLIK